MPSSIVVGDILSARAWVSLDEQAAVNTFNYECIAITGGACTDQTFANAIDTGFAPFYKGLVPSTVTYKGIQAYFLKQGAIRGYARAVQSVAGSGAGTATGNPVPRNTCAVMKYSTPIRGPAGRGRIYLPFLASSWVANNGRPTVGAEVYINSFASTLPSPVTLTSGGSTATMVFVVVHRPKAAVPVVRGQVDICESADKFGQMHKRGDYGRANASPI